MKMIPKDKENLFVLLRSYHEAPAPLHPSSPETGRFVSDVESTADKIISMMLGLLRGNAEYKDWTPDLNSLDVKVKPKSTHTEVEKGERKLLSDKVTHLRAIVALAHAHAE